VPAIAKRYRIQDAYPVCAFSVLGARYPAFGANPVRVSGIRYQVPGSRYLTPGTWYQVPAFEKPAHGVCMMQDKKGSAGYLVLGTWYLAPLSHSRISNLIC
jgi:hypothetical protein